MKREGKKKTFCYHGLCFNKHSKNEVKISNRNDTREQNDKETHTSSKQNHKKK